MRIIYKLFIIVILTTGFTFPLHAQDRVEIPNPAHTNNTVDLKIGAKLDCEDFCSEAAQTQRREGNDICPMEYSCLQLAAIEMGIPLTWDSPVTRETETINLCAMLNKANGEFVTFPADLWGVPEELLDDNGDMSGDALNRLKDNTKLCLEERVKASSNNDLDSDSDDAENTIGNDAVADFLIDMALEGVGELGPVGAIISGLAGGVMNGNDINNSLCDVLKPYEALLRSSPASVNDAQTFLAAIQGAADFPPVANVGGSRDLARAVNRMEGAKKLALANAVFRFRHQHCPD